MIGLRSSARATLAAMAMAGGTTLGLAHGAGAAPLAATTPACSEAVTPAFNANIISNPGAEANPGPYTTSLGTSYYAVPDCWTSTNNAGATQTGGASGTFTSYPYTEKTAVNSGYTIDHSADPTAGNNFFYGGDGASTTATAANPAVTTGTQTIDVSALNPGGGGFTLGGYLGGYKTQADNAKVTATFLDGSGNALGSGVIGPVTPTQRGSVSTLVFQSTTGTVPAGTASVRVTITMTEVSPNNDDGYADDLSLVLTAPSSQPTGALPEAPLAVGLPIAAVAVLGGGLLVRRRRQQRQG